jgi:hypothetical protein
MLYIHFKPLAHLVEQSVAFDTRHALILEAICSMSLAASPACNKLPARRCSPHRLALLLEPRQMGKYFCHATSCAMALWPFITRSGQHCLGVLAVQYMQPGASALDASCSFGRTSLRSPIPFWSGLAYLIKADCCSDLGTGASGSDHSLFFQRFAKAPLALVIKHPARDAVFSSLRLAISLRGEIGHGRTPLY